MGYDGICNSYTTNNMMVLVACLNILNMGCGPPSCGHIYIYTHIYIYIILAHDDNPLELVVPHFQTCLNPR